MQGESPFFSYNGEVTVVQKHTYPTQESKGLCLDHSPSVKVCS